MDEIQAIAPAVVAGLIAAGSAAAGAISRGTQARKQRKLDRSNIILQTGQNKELAKFAYDQDLAQWERQNLYNTPAQQMERFKAAGLNPNLIYGQGSGGNASASPQYSQVRAEKAEAVVAQHNPAQMLSQYQQFQQANAQLDLTQAAATHEKRKSWGQAILNGLTGKRSEKLGIDLGETMNMDSPYFLQSQATTSKMQSDATMKALEAEWWKSLKGVGAGGNIIRTLMMMFKKK